MDQSLDLLHDTAEGLAAVLAVKDKELSDKAKLINERLLFPILAGAKMTYQRSFSRSLFEGKLFKMDITTSIIPMEKQ
jgi:hypothetical protein